MENLSDALIMAGQALIFIVALTVCISSFTTLRVGVDEVVGQTETLQMAKGEEGYINYIDSQKANAARVVGAETVVSSMYRAIKENYVIYIVAEDCETLAGSGSSAVDLTEAKTPLTIETEAGTKNVITEGKKIIKVTIGIDTNQEINEKLAGGFYERIKNLSFYEYLGEYQNSSSEGVSSENKQTYRIITYIEKTYYDGL